MGDKENVPSWKDHLAIWRQVDIIVGMGNLGYEPKDIGNFISRNKEVIKNLPGKSKQVLIQNKHKVPVPDFSEWFVRMKKLGY